MSELRAAQPVVETTLPPAVIVNCQEACRRALEAGSMADRRDVLRHLVLRVEARRIGHARYSVNITCIALGRRLYDAPADMEVLPT